MGGKVYCLKCEGGIEEEYITSPSGKTYHMECALSSMDKALSRRPLSDGE